MSKLRLVPSAGGTPIEIDGTKVIGRDAGADIVVDDNSVSRKHARIEPRGDAWAVVDEASANGTFVNGQRITDAGLRHGQSLRIGEVLYKVEVEGGDEDLAATRLGVARPPLPPPPPPSTAAMPSASSAGTGTRKQGKSPMVYVAGCCGCLLLLALVVFLLGLAGAIAIPSLDRMTGKSGPAAPGDTTSDTSTTAPSGGHKLKLDATRPTKTKDGDQTKVEVTLTVTGYGTRPSGSAFELDLQEDLETIGPGGTRLEDLSKENIERRQSFSETAEGPPQAFTSTLTIDSNPPAGRYTVRMTITDHITGTTGVKTATFTLP
jgi:hypothetical protein